jgi:hypothetical protein
MGCDIHWFVEKYTTEPENETVPNSKVNKRDNRVNELLGEKSDPRWISMDKWEAEDYGGGNMHWSNYPNNFYNGRNYTLFAKLAGVRSWHGDSAICPPKGIPDDASDAYIYITKQWEGDGHSHSYFTLKELLDEDWSEFEEFQETLKEMSKLDDNPENIRAVFFFDN